VTPTAPLLPSDVLNEMKQRALGERSLVVRLTLLFAVVSAGVALVQAAGGFGQAVSLGLSLLAGVAYTGVISQLICVPGSSREISGLWKEIAPILARLVWVTLLVAVGTGLGLLFFVVPGLILLTIWSVAQPTVVAERATVVDSLNRSRELVRGNGLRVFLFLLVLLLIGFLAATVALLVAVPFGTGVIGVTVASALVALIVNPLVAIGTAALYNCLSGGSLADRALTDSPDPVEDLP
jgi:hypothetical protein